jgi:hypothetical protein
MSGLLAWWGFIETGLELQTGPTDARKPPSQGHHPKFTPA